jgi:histone deacetylase 1/2
VCAQAKQRRKSHTTAEVSNLVPLELIHSGICGMNDALTKGGKKYFMMFINDYNRYSYVYLLKSKDGALNFSNSIKSITENQLDQKIKRLRSDRDGD